MDTPDDMDFEQLAESAAQASALMKTLGHSGRLMVLCQLARGEKSVGELAKLLDMSQSPLSQHLSRMRSEGLVSTRRDAQNIFYSLKSDEAGKIMECLYGLYCATD